MIRALYTRLRQFAAARDGVAAVEFALILPVMLLLYVGTMEASALISMDRRVQTITGTIGDLVARADTTISSDQLQDYFLAAQHILAPYSTTGLVETVTLVRVDADGNTEIAWSRKFTGGASSHSGGHTTGEPYDLPQAFIDIAEGSYVVVSEAQYTYTPLVGLVFDQEYPLYRENFYMPRFGGPITYVPET
jgi:Flp pilus assembly protein TadG